MEIKGKVLEWDWGGEKRRYIQGSMTQDQFEKFTFEEIFNAETGEGNQRVNDKKHVTNLVVEINAGNYVPSDVTLSVRPERRNDIKIKNGIAVIEVGEAEEERLLNIDGHHRKSAFKEVSKDKVEHARKMATNPIPFILLLDGNPSKDHVKKNFNKQINKDHILSMRMFNNIVDAKEGPFMSLATEIARLLHKDSTSFCFKRIQLDTQVEKRLPLSLNALCTKAPAKLAFSLFGSAKIAHKHGKDAVWAKDNILLAYTTLRDNPETVGLLETGMVLDPFTSNTGLGLMIGVGNMLSERCRLLDQDSPSDNDLELLVVSAKKTLDHKLKSKDTGQKVEVFHDFYEAYSYDIRNDGKDIENLDEEGEVEAPTMKLIGSHEGIPVPSIALLSPSTFGVSKLPTEGGGKKRGRKPKVAPEVANEIEDRVDEDNESTNLIEGVLETPPEDPEWISEDNKNKDSINKLVAAGMIESDDDETCPWETDDD
jgi:hypothetical protein